VSHAPDTPQWRGVKCPHCGGFVTRILWSHDPRCWECASCMLRWRQGAFVEGVQVIRAPWSWDSDGTQEDTRCEPT
jgi:hypothetical protein